MEIQSYFVYIIESLDSGIWYVGLSVDPEARLKQHNQGKSKFTKGHIPWKLIYTEFVGDIRQAREREKYYKSSSAKNRLRKKLKTL
jgi:putative endonuclease